MNLDVQTILEIIFTVVFSIIALLLIMIYPILRGIEAAKKAKKSPHWMWFGIHPIGGWIAFYILNEKSKRVTDDIDLDELYENKSEEFNQKEDLNEGDIQQNIYNYHFKLSYKRRIGAFIMDNLIILLQLAVISFIIGLFNKGTISNHVVDNLIVIIYFFLIIFRMIILVSKNGQTPSMKARNIKISKYSGAEINFFQALIRFLYLYSGIGLIINVAYLVFKNKKVNFQDQISKTRIILNEKLLPSSEAYGYELDEDTKKLLINGIYLTDYSINKTAVQYLEYFRVTESIPYIYGLLKDEKIYRDINMEISQMMIKAFFTIGGEDSITYLKQIGNANDYYIKKLFEHRSKYIDFVEYSFHKSEFQKYANLAASILEQLKINSEISARIGKKVLQLKKERITYNEIKELSFCDIWNIICAEPGQITYYIGIVGNKINDITNNDALLDSTEIEYIKLFKELCSIELDPMLLFIRLYDDYYYKGKNLIQMFNIEEYSK